MSLLNPSLQKQVREIFAALPNPVTLALFRRSSEPCESCHDVRQLAEELASISNGRVIVETHDLDGDAGAATLYGIDKVPAVAVLGDESGRRDFGIRFFGAPVGYEFATLLEDIRMASAGTADLSPRTVEALSRLESPLHLQVFVTPTCPYCPRAVLLAHKMAMVSELVTADAVDASEFPELAERYHVHGVPRTVANEIVHVEGAVPEAMLMQELADLIGGKEQVRAAG